MTAIGLALSAGYALQPVLAQSIEVDPNGGWKKDEKPDAAPEPEAAPVPEPAPAKKAEAEKPAYESGDEEARRKALDNLYAYLATADDTQSAQKLAIAIERIWLDPGSPTISVLMERAINAVNNDKNELAMKLMDAVVELAPDYAEGWNRRAFVFHMQQKPAQAMADLQRALVLEPNHFKALDGVAKVLLSAGKKEGALKAMKKLREIHPFWPTLDKSIEDLEREVEGQGI